MKIRVVDLREDLSGLNKDEEIVHLAFRPSNKDILILIQTCKKLKGIQIPPSYEKTTSKPVRMMLEMEGIALIKGDIRGYRSDIDEYYKIKPDLYDLIKKLKSERKTEQQIISQVSKKTRLSKDMIRFLINQS